MVSDRNTEYAPRSTVNPSTKRQRVDLIRPAAVLLAILFAGFAGAEDLSRVDFESDHESPVLKHIWGDTATGVDSNCIEGAPGERAARLRVTYTDNSHNLAYWQIDFPHPVPILEALETLSFRVKTNVPIHIKVPIHPFGFIYHGPGVKPNENWQTVSITDAHAQLKAWCANGNQDSGDGYIPGLIVAVADTKTPCDVLLDDVVATGAPGARKKLEDEVRRRRFRRTQVSVVTLPFDAQGRSLSTVLERLDEAAAAGSDIVCLPMECVETEGEPIPGPITDAIAAKAREHHMHVIGNIRESAGDKTYVTSFLCDRAGELVGTYRKSHKMPDEDMDLGNDLPVFSTDIGTVAMRIGSDRYFPEIDYVYTAKGAGIIFWSQMPEPVEDEYLQDMPSLGRAQDYRVLIACSRYSRAEDGWITNKFPPYRGSPVGRSYIVNREGQRIACTTRKGAVATAVIPAQELKLAGRQANPQPAFAAMTNPVVLPEMGQWSKRRVRVTAIENHLGFDDLLNQLDQAGQLGSDIVCTYEFVWVPVHGETPDPSSIAKLESLGRERCAQVAAKARQWNMYVILCGVLRERKVNEGIIFDREGREQGRYIKMATTYAEQVPGTETPVFTTDFGRIAVRICADNWMVQQDRCYSIKGADIVFFSTQDWGPDAIHRNLRAISRCMDGQFFHVQATHSCTETMHRSLIIDPAGVPVARSALQRPGLVSAVIDLDHDRPRRYTRRFTPHTPNGYLPQYQPHEFPEVRNDLKSTILQQRRPDLYQVLGPEQTVGK